VIKIDVETTRMGERGQVVIPHEFREQLKLKKGEKLLAVLEGDKIIMEPMKNLKTKQIEDLREDLAEMKIVKKFWEDVKKGNIIRQSKDEFLAELEEW